MVNAPSTAGNIALTTSIVWTLGAPSPIINAIKAITISYNGGHPIFAP